MADLTSSSKAEILRELRSRAVSDDRVKPGAEFDRFLAAIVAVDDILPDPEEGDPYLEETTTVLNDLEVAAAASPAWLALDAAIRSFPPDVPDTEQLIDRAEAFRDFLEERTDG